MFSFFFLQCFCSKIVKVFHLHFWKVVPVRSRWFCLCSTACSWGCLRFRWGVCPSWETRRWECWTQPAGWEQGPALELEKDGWRLDIKHDHFVLFSLLLLHVMPFVFLDFTQEHLLKTELVFFAGIYTLKFHSPHLLVYCKNNYAVFSKNL